MDMQTRMTVTNMLVAVLMHKLDIEEITVTNEDIMAARKTFGSKNASMSYDLNLESKKPSFTAKIIPTDD